MELKATINGPFTPETVVVRGPDHRPRPSDRGGEDGGRPVHVQVQVHPARDQTVRRRRAAVDRDELSRDGGGQVDAVQRPGEESGSQSSGDREPAGEDHAERRRAPRGSTAATVVGGALRTPVRRPELGTYAGARARERPDPEQSLTESSSPVHLRVPHRLQGGH
ncbi:hypothetical protein QTP88_015329 [Uroleucon formosanum]